MGEESICASGFFCCPRDYPQVSQNSSLRSLRNKAITHSYSFALEMTKKIDALHSRHNLPQSRERRQAFVYHNEDLSWPNTLTNKQKHVLEKCLSLGTD